MKSGEPLTSGHTELMTAKASFSFAMLQNEAMGAVVQSGLLGELSNVGDELAVLCEPTYTPLQDGTWLMGLRFNSPYGSPNGRMTENSDVRYLPLGFFDIRENVVDPHPELIEMLKLADIEPADAIQLGIFRTWESNWNSMISSLRNRVIFNEDYSVALIPQDTEPVVYDSYF